MMKIRTPLPRVRWMALVARCDGSAIEVNCCALRQQQMVSVGNRHAGES